MHWATSKPAGVPLGVPRYQIFLLNGFHDDLVHTHFMGGFPQVGIPSYYLLG